MSYQITLTMGRNDRTLANFLIEREGLSDIGELTGTNVRNQLYALMAIMREAE